MNTAQLKIYAPEARNAFIAAVTAQAGKLGVTAAGTSAAKTQGDVLLIDGQAFPKSVATTRRSLADRVKDHGFGQTMEAVAYTWFNRFVALRYMELHGYLDHGYRVLSHPDGDARPELLDHATDVDLPGLDADKVLELKLDGTKDEELYRLLLKAQCNALHRAMPFLFEKIGDETELLLPANLLHSDSLIRQLVNNIDEELWQDIEIIGWLYQFYISEKKDQVIGKVVKSEDIPAATQRFTPNWVVKYMVHNALGAQWLSTYPESPLKGEMEYYIEPADQTDEVNAQLATITPTSLDPEKITLMDPACGSGHILVEAYDLFKTIYLERGYRRRDVAQLILEKNLFGLDIDERAAQLAGFALMMKGRADDRPLFERGVKINVMALVDSAGFDAEAVGDGVELSGYGLKTTDLTELKQLFEHATTFGSLIQVPAGLAKMLRPIKQLSKAAGQGLFESEALSRLGPLVRQAELLAAKYDAVVANPPYVGSKFHVPVLKKFLKDCYDGYEKDVFSAFIDRNLAFSKRHGRLGFMSPFVWMFISSYEQLRTRLVETETITSLVQLEYSGFDGATVPICTFTLQKNHLKGQKSCFIRLSEFRGSENQGPKTLEAINDRGCGWFYEAAQDKFRKIPGSPVAYWASERVLHAFEVGRPMNLDCSTRKGMATGLNAEFVRAWYEVPICRIGIGKTRDEAKVSGLKWFPYANGGAFRKWYGHYDDIVNWESDGRRLQTEEHVSGRVRAVNLNLEFIYTPGLSWTSITSSLFSIRSLPVGFLFSSASNALFRRDDEEPDFHLALLNSKVHAELSKVLNPTLNANPGDVGKIPILTSTEMATELTKKLLGLARFDWDAYERSWDFQSLPLLTASSESTHILKFSYTTWITQSRETIAEMKRLEEENNRLFIDAYGLADELTPDVPVEQITLTMNPAYRYGTKITEEEQWTRFRQNSMEELVSYAIGCLMGRYSLNEPGLIYANSGNNGFDPSRYSTFPADDDGIVPLTDTNWFSDDACNRLVEFMSVAWDKSGLEENLNFLAANLAPKKNETSRDTIRRYLCDKFFKDHMKTYKKRPIYWLFSSGKQKAFQCLVYLHRYNEGTLSRMRSEYVIPLQGKMAARLEKLQGDIQAATSSAQSKALTKERAKLEKQQHELITFDEKLRHYADRRISLDLDDGVKVNYGKFGDLLAEVKAIHGKKAEVE